MIKMKNSIRLIALAVIVGASSCTGGKKDSQANVKDEKPIVKLADVTARPVDQTQEYTATVQANIRNSIAPSAPVRIDKILVEVGDRVGKGQKLVIMDQANLNKMKMQLEFEKLEFKRTDELYKVGGISKSDWENARTALKVNETSYQNLLENTALISPISGVVTARNYDNGDMYNGGEPVVVVEQIAPVKLLINVSETHFPQVRKGMPVSIKLDTYGDETFEGKVNLVYPTIDENTRTFPVEILLANQEQKVRPGMFARVTLDFGKTERVVVPDLSIVKQAGSGDRYVYVYKDGKVTYNKVQLGRRMGSEYELISGVDNHSKVVVAGQARLRDGVEVEVEK